MLFPTAIFALFFFAVFSVSWPLRNLHFFRKLFLIAASYVFYAAWDVRFVLLLVLSSVVNYVCGYLTGVLVRQSYRRVVLVFGIIFNLSLLGFFKYYGFFLESLDELLIRLGLERELPFMDIVLPVGISFFTFQGISYVVDVYRRDTPPARSVFDVMLYISFFPQLVAGPIVRAADFIPQLRQAPKLNWPMINLGFLLIAIGLFKKTVIANYLATDIVDEVFFDPSMHSGIDLMVALYAYTVQIYCDFSAYSDIAVGVALLMGYRFNINFDQPYRAASVHEYWRRWHISLSTWLRDYFFKPMRGSNRNKAYAIFLVFLTMFVSGLWHGAAWTFVAWGVMHGLWLVGERLMGWGRTSARTMTGWIVGFLIAFHVITTSRIFFRSPDFDIASMYWEGLFSAETWALPALLTTPFVVGMITLGMSFHFLPNGTNAVATKGLTRLAWPMIGVLLGLALVAIDALGPGGVTPFIYFQF